MGVQKMLGICFMQRWFDLSGQAMEDALYDVQSMGRFVSIDLSPDPVPDETPSSGSAIFWRNTIPTARLLEATYGYLEEDGQL